jgi:site-specific recombinase XerD
MTSRWIGFCSPLATGIEMFLAQKQALGFQLRTTESVLRLLDRFLVEQHVYTTEAITPAVIAAFLVSRPRTVPHSFNQLLGIVARLFEWLIARDLISQSPVQTNAQRSTASRLPFLFDPPTARRLLDAALDLPDTRNTPHRGLTYKTIFGLLYGLGLRVGEAARLCLKDIDLSRQLLIVRETKFAKSRLVPFGPHIGQLVANYLDNRELTRYVAPASIADVPVFTFRKLQPISPCTISTVFHEIVSRLALSVPDGTRPPCVHSLRHSFAVGTLLRWYRNGADPTSRLLQLSTFMGHVNPRSTAVYLTITVDLLTEASQRFERWAEPLIREITR